jgi:hypothetical protein
VTRIERARRRAAGAKRALAAASIASFAFVLLLARTSHPGHAASPGASSAATVTLSTTSGDAVPQVQTHVS